MSRCIACLTAWLVVGCGGGGAAAPPASDASGAPTASPAAGAEFAAGEEDTFVNKTVGLRLKKPKGWFFETAQFETENRERTKWANEKMDEGVKRATLPLVVVVKHRPPYDGIG